MKTGSVTNTHILFNGQKFLRRLDLTHHIQMNALSFNNSIHYLPKFNDDPASYAFTWVLFTESSYFYLKEHALCSNIEDAVPLETARYVS